MTRCRYADEIAIRLSPPDPEAESLDAVRTALISGGYYESVTFGWVSDLLAADFTPPEAIGLPRADAAVRKADASLRPSILPGLLESVRRNENVGTPDAGCSRLARLSSLPPAEKWTNAGRWRSWEAPTSAKFAAWWSCCSIASIPQRDLRVIADSRPGFARAACGANRVGRADRRLSRKD